VKLINRFQKGRVKLINRFQKGWLWPVGHFWRFTPLQWVLAVIWNFAEVFDLPLKNPPWWFNRICRASKQRRIL
jgi:hypothetical protein